MRIFRIIINAIVLVMLSAVLWACGQHVMNSGSGESVDQPDGSLRIGTYNVHYIWLGRKTGSWSVGDWDRRKAPLNAAFNAVDADVVGFQEMESFDFGSSGDTNLTLDYLLENNLDYAAAAVGDVEVFPSTQPILYRKEALTLLDQGWFFFSETPDVIYSRTFNGSFPAFASWAKFQRADGTEFRVYNVHFEYKSVSNQTLSAELVKTRITPFIEAGETVFLIGDVNARLGSGVVGILEGAGLAFSPIEGSTYHFNRGVNLFGAIDHIAVTDGAELLGTPVVLRRKFMDEWPTDHYPVFADFELR